MPHHDIIVIGMSAGGLDASMAIIRALPAELPAALFVVTHMTAEGPSFLPDILSRAGPPRPTGQTATGGNQHCRWFSAMPAPGS